jgi:hypothetical protein
MVKNKVIFVFISIIMASILNQTFGVYRGSLSHAGPIFRLMLQAGVDYGGRVWQGMAE